MIWNRRVGVLALGLVAVAGGCRRKPATTPAPAPTPVTMTRPAVDSAAIRDSIARAAVRRAAYDDSVLRAREAALGTDASRGHAALTAVIHFQYDQAELSDEARGLLDAKASVLLANPDVHLRIAGHTDERGSTEYNLALGERRAVTAKRYLVERGVPDSRLETASFGEEQPVCQGTDESCWSQNRRDEFTITAGGARLVRGAGRP